MKYQINPDGTLVNKFGKRLKPLLKDGYYRYCLSVDNKQKYEYAHRLVAKAFIPNPENKPCVNHIDGDKTNNDVSNLEWCTYAENEQHSYKSLGKKPSRGMLGKTGSRNYKSRPVLQFTLNDVYVKRHESCRQAGEELGQNYKNIWNAAKGHYMSSAGFKWVFENEYN